jgi:hypothetical protein
VGCFAVINTPSLVSNIITGVSGGMTSSPVSGTMAAGAIGALTYKGIGALRGMISSPNNGSSLSNSILLVLDLLFLLQRQMPILKFWRSQTFRESLQY